MTFCCYAEREYISGEVESLMELINSSNGAGESWIDARNTLEIIESYKLEGNYSKLEPEEKKEIGLLETACQNIIDEKLNWE